MPHTTTDIAAEGTTLAITIATVVTDIGLVTELEPADPEVPVRDVSVLTSTSKKKRPGLVDFGKASGKLFFDPNDTVHVLCRQRAITPAAALDTFTLIYNDGMTTTHATDTFTGFFTKFKPTGITVNGTVEAEFEIEITDSLTVAQGS